MNLNWKNNKIVLIKKKLKFLVEVTLETDGSITISPKLALLLTQSGIFENTVLYEFLEDYFSLFEIDEEIEVNKSFLVSFLFFFNKKNKKTKIYVFNPFYNSTLNLILKYNLIDFYFKYKFNINYFNIKNKYKKIRLFSENYWKYVLNLRKIITKNKKKRFSFLFLKKKKYYFKYLVYNLNIKKKKLRRKNLCKKIKYKRFFNFYFLIKAKKWLDYFFFFKLIILSSYYFSIDYSYLNLKLHTHSFVAFSFFYRNWFLKKLRRKFFIRKKFGRNKYGELMLIIRPIILKKKNAKK